MAFLNSDLRHSVLRPSADIQSVCVRQLDSEAGFILAEDNSLMTLSKASLDGMISVAKELDFSHPIHLRLGIDLIREICTSLFLFHELSHIPQGVAKFSDVQLLKRTAGKNQLAEMDTAADIYAASAYAAMQCSLSDDSKAVYAQTFMDMLIFMVEVCFPAFGFSMDKPHKVCRGLGILISICQAQDALEKPTKLLTPFDRPIFPIVSANFEEVAIKVLGPVQHSFDLKVIANPKKLKDLCHSLESGETTTLIAMIRNVLA